MQKPVIPNQDELYDELMAKIEPDLTRSQLPLLETKYAGETEAEKKKRMERYSKAFTAFYKALKEYFAELNTQINAYKKYAMKDAEVQVTAKEQEHLSSLESMFTS